VAESSWHLGPPPRKPSWKLNTEPPHTIPDPVPAVRLRTSEGGGMPTMFGRFASFGEWAEINNVLEGHFLERMAPAAFEKTIQEHRDKIRVLFHHGQDPTIGFAVLGPIRSLNPDTSYEVDLFDVDYVHRLLPGLRSGVYGVSFRFSVTKDELRQHPTRSDWNPKALPEVTVVEAGVTEFGPTPLPAYKNATAAVRSGTATDAVQRLVRDMRTSAHLLARNERWATRSKPGEPGVLERERITGGQRASWETRPSGARNRWWLPPDTDWRLDSTPRSKTVTRKGWHLA
jgi:phage head maturation protease